jgi:ribosomal protein S18 acetylase RimI-like enzyme
MEALTLINKAIAPNTSGTFYGHNTTGNPIILEWERIDPLASRFNEKIKGLSEILVQTYSQLELEFARKFPEVAPNEYFLTSLAHLFADPEKIDWPVVEKGIESIFTNVFTTTDFSKYSAPSDIYLFVVAKSELTGAPIGLVQFLINAEYPQGTVKACYSGIDRFQQNTGLEKLLMSTIFKILPSTKRVFLHTRSTNEKAINQYLSWGFNQFPGPMENWPDFEYVAEQSTLLQTSAAKITE